MKQSTICITLAILLASCQTFKIYKHSLEEDQAINVSQTGRPDMPCATVVPSIYKAFGFYMLHNGKNARVKLLKVLRKLSLMDLLSLLH